MNTDSPFGIACVGAANAVFFRWDISVIFCWDISVICLTVILKLAVTVFISLYLQTFWPKWLNFFWSFQKRFGLWPKKWPRKTGWRAQFQCKNAATRCERIVLCRSYRLWFPCLSFSTDISFEYFKQRDARFAQKLKYHSWGFAIGSFLPGFISPQLHILASWRKDTELKPYGCTYSFGSSLIVNGIRFTFYFPVHMRWKFQAT